MAVHEGPAPAHRVQAADEAADAFERAGCIELGLAAGTARRDRVAVRAAAGERRGVAEQLGRVIGRVISRTLARFAALQHERRHDRHLRLGELEREGVFFEDLRVAPAPRPIELGHHRAAVFEKELEDAVLVGVELQDAAVAAKAHRIERLQHLLGREVVVDHGRAGWGVAPNRLSVPHGRRVDDLAVVGGERGDHRQAAGHARRKAADHAVAAKGGFPRAEEVRIGPMRGRRRG
jgi:hypothetical protein